MAKRLPFYKYVVQARRAVWESLCNVLSWAFSNTNNRLQQKQADSVFLRRMTFWWREPTSNNASFENVLVLLVRDTAAAASCTPKTCSTIRRTYPTFPLPSFLSKCLLVKTTLRSIKFRRTRVCATMKRSVYSCRRRSPDKHAHAPISLVGSPSEEDYALRTRVHFTRKPVSYPLPTRLECLLLRGKEKATPCDRELTFPEMEILRRRKRQTVLPPKHYVRHSFPTKRRISKTYIDSTGTERAAGLATLPDASRRQPTLVRFLSHAHLSLICTVVLHERSVPSIYSILAANLSL